MSVEQQIVNPLLYHAKPSDFDISQKALKRPRNEEPTATAAGRASKSSLLSPSLYIFKKESFQDLSEYLPERLIEILEKEKVDHSNQYGLGLSSTTKIQSVVIRFLLDGTSSLNSTAISSSSVTGGGNHINKILIKSQTGSGKTLSYLIPIVATFTSMNAAARRDGSMFAPINRSDGTRALIVVPTRELCNQVTTVSTKIINYCCCNVVIGNVTGGEKRKSEKARLRKGITLLIVTPGRFLDHLRTTESLSLKYLQFIVLDEIDKLLELGESTISSDKSSHVTGVTTSGGFGTGNVGADGSGSTLLNDHNAVYEILKIILQGDMGTLLNFGVNKDIKGSQHSSANRQAALQGFINMHNGSYEEKFRQQSFLATRTVQDIGVPTLSTAKHNNTEGAQNGGVDQGASVLSPIPPSTSVKLIMVTATLTNLVKKMANKILMNDSVSALNSKSESNSSLTIKGKNTKMKLSASGKPLKPKSTKPSMAIIDGEKESIYVINSLSTLETLGRDSGKLDGSLVGDSGGAVAGSATPDAESMNVDGTAAAADAGATTTATAAVAASTDDHPLYAAETKDINRGQVTNDGCISFLDEELSDDDEDEEEEGGKGGKGLKGGKGSRHSLLSTGERMDDAVPKQLAQYFMVVTCKWRLAALLSFIKLHTHKNEKVIVFFSTCDSVDYHALLLKQAGLYNYKGKGGVDRTAAGPTTKLDNDVDEVNWPTDFEDRERQNAADASHFHNNADILTGMDVYSSGNGNGSGSMTGRALLNPFNHKQRLDDHDEFGSIFKKGGTQDAKAKPGAGAGAGAAKSAFGHKGGKDSAYTGKDATGKDKDRTRSSPNPSAKDILEPLESKFKSKLFGKGTTFYRLHGNVPNHIRQSVYKDFCSSTSGASVLLCTDVAARGLDLPLVSWILQYDPPSETIDYIHRVGRTARRGQQGSSLLFLLPTELPYVQLLSSHGLSSDPLSLQQVFLDVSKQFMNYDRLLRKYGYGSAAGGESSKVDEISAVIIQKRLEQTVSGNNILCQAGKQAFRSFVRGYATHTNDYVSSNSKKNRTKLKLGNGLDADITINKSASPFSIHNLHLGHVAKSFALLDQPSQLRNTGNHHDDIIGQVFNCMYSADKFAHRRPGFGSSSAGPGGGPGDKRPEFANINPNAPPKRPLVANKTEVPAASPDTNVAAESAAALSLLKSISSKSGSDNVDDTITIASTTGNTPNATVTLKTKTEVPSAYAGMATEAKEQSKIFNDKIVNPSRPVVAMQKIRKLSAASNTTTNAKKSGHVKKNDEYKGRFQQAQSGDLGRKMHKKHQQTMSEFQS